MKLFTVILTVLFALQVASAQPINEEKILIQGFLDYVNTLTDITYGKSLKKTKTIFEETLKQIPAEQQGSTSALLKKFIEDADRVEHSSSSVEKKAVLDNFMPIMGNAGPSAVPTPETMAIGSQLMSFIFSIKAIDDERASKIVKASNYLRSRLSLEGISRNQRLFQLLSAYENDSNNGEKYLVDMMALKQ